MAQDPTLPDVIRMKALRGFRTQVGGRFSIVNPGDVVEVDKLTAMDLRLANKAISTSDPIKQDASYMPARKRATLHLPKRAEAT